MEALLQRLDSLLTKLSQVIDLDELLEDTSDALECFLQLAQSFIQGTLDDEFKSDPRAVIRKVLCALAGVLARVRDILDGAGDDSWQLGSESVSRAQVADMARVAGAERMAGQDPSYAIPVKESIEAAALSSWLLPILVKLAIQLIEQFIRDQRGQ